MNIYEQALAFKRKYPKTIAWRIKAHSKVAQTHVNPDETVKYVFACQKTIVLMKFLGHLLLLLLISESSLLKKD